MDSNGLFIFEAIALFPYYLVNNWYGVRFLRMLQIGSVLEYYQLFCNKVTISSFFFLQKNLFKMFLPKNQPKVHGFLHIQHQPY